MPRPRPFSHDYFHEELTLRLKKQDICFDFLVQFFVDTEKTPIEDISVPWLESESPYSKLAELVIPSRDLDSEEAKAEQTYIDSLGFNCWHASDDHRPLGNLQRARKMIYEASAAGRKRNEDSSYFATQTNTWDKGKM